MTREEVISMAFLAGLLPNNEIYEEDLLAFSAIVEERVAAAEREACAQICDAMDCDGESYPADCAIAIRTRGESK